jgi:hypothetical protein
MLLCPRETQRKGTMKSIDMSQGNPYFFVCCNNFFLLLKSSGQVDINQFIFIFKCLKEGI